MLKLRKVDLLGFKSFCEKTHLTFSGTGVTCIVGPNGCGKSNIVDAITWVLGEQSHKLLRAERMSDCIFNGTAKRPPMGLSEVSLTLVDPELSAAAAFVMGEEKAAEAGEGSAAAVVAEAGVAEGIQIEVTEIAEGSELPDSPETAEVSEVVEGVAAAEGVAVEEGAAGEGFLAKKKRRGARPVPQVKPGEVVVGRRLYRSGQSEYLINGRVARLRDIQELFMGMGLGPDSYAIIEQGRIGQILSTKPTDRRAIIEEAAGVTKYKTKRRLAEAKLESSKLNLSRVNDILVEVEKQLASLKRQAAKARRFAELREQMRGLMRTVLASKARELDGEAERLEVLLRDAATVEAEASRGIEGLEGEQERLSARTYELEGILRQSQNQLNQVALELDRAQNRIGFNRERMKELDARGGQLVIEIEQAGAQVEQLTQRAAEHRQILEELRAEQGEKQRALDAVNRQVLESSGSEQMTEAGLEELRREIQALAEEIARTGSEHAQAVEAVGRHTDSEMRISQTEAQVVQQMEELRALRGSAQAQQAAAEAEARRLAGAMQEAQSKIVELKQELQQTSARNERIREEWAGARARRSSIEQLLNDRAYTAEAVQKLFAAHSDAPGREFRAVGVLADYAEVDEQYEGAVEQFLRDELEYVVVETFDHARAGVALLREEVGGRATFFVDSLHKLTLPPLDSAILFPTEQSLVARLDKLVNFREPLGEAAKHFLTKLRCAFLVDSAAAAEKLARDNPAYYFVTLDGTCYHGRMVSGGRAGEAGPLAMKRELRGLEAEAVRCEREAAETLAALRRIEEESQAAEALQTRTMAQHVEAERALVAATHGHARAAAELAQVEARGAEVGAEIGRLRAAAQAARLRVEQVAAKNSEAVMARGAKEAALAAAIESLAGMRRTLQQQQEELAVRRAEAAAISERLLSAESVMVSHAEKLREGTERARALREQQTGLGGERASLETATGESERLAASFAKQKGELEQHVAALEKEWEEIRVRTVQVDDALRQSRQKLGDMREERSRHEIERARNSSDRDHLRDTCLAELNLHPEDLLAETGELMEGETLAAAEQQYRELKMRIENMGAVNLMALEEYSECEQRFDFLTRERDDLVKGIEDTRQTIAELDTVSREKFNEAFTAINRNFAVAFTTLFGGGAGEMRLTEPDSSGEPGIDVVAQPPGKRLQNVLLLSGGEKALTALALLIAIFRYQPSPFCILDEVDAPLDEANVGRFTRLVAEMSAETQFIIVTHNRRTMEMAPVLYGVTMQEPGVSKLVSVRWSETEKAEAPKAASNAA